MAAGTNDFVFAHPDGTLWDPSTVSHALNRVTRQADLPHIGKVSQIS